jgi:drug/metabolite transporter (DMT)-like permease
VHAALLLAQLGSGSLVVEGKLAMGPRFGVSPLALTMIRLLGGTLVFAAAYRALGAPRVTGARARAALAVLAIFGVVLNQALFLAGLNRTSPIAATLLVATIPVFTTAISVAVGRDRLTPRGLLGTALALLGIAVLSNFTLPHVGDVLVLLNALSYALYCVFAKGPLSRHGSVAVMAWVFGWGALFFAPFGGAVLLREAPTWSPGAIGMVAYIVLVPTILSYGMSAWALRRASPALVTAYVYLQPFFVVVLAWLQLGQALEVRALAAGALIFGGVALVASAARHRARVERA